MRETHKLSTNKVSPEKPKKRVKSAIAPKPYSDVVGIATKFPKHAIHEKECSKKEANQICPRCNVGFDRKSCLDQHMRSCPIIPAKPQLDDSGFTEDWEEQEEVSVLETPLEKSSFAEVPALVDAASQTEPGIFIPKECIGFCY